MVDKDDLISREMALGALLGSMCGTGYQSRAMRVIRMLPPLDVGEVMASQWVRMDEQKPPFLKEVCMYSKKYKRMFYGMLSKTGRYVFSESEAPDPLIEDISHWMPKPLPPKEDE